MISGLPGVAGKFRGCRRAFSQGLALHRDELFKARRDYTRRTIRNYSGSSAFASKIDRRTSEIQIPLPADATAFEWQSFSESSSRIASSSYSRTYMYNRLRPCRAGVGSRKLECNFKGDDP